jgi:hypothetical protein
MMRRDWGGEVTPSVLAIYIEMARTAYDSGSEAAFKGALQLLLDELICSEYLAAPSARPNRPGDID